ncbi:MAG TPA: flagellar hook-length control protein FliK [Symbiobacteriaceae bacterium]|nr:flagellar hook-length control protein FliK [Symbiobacteriaceae bacterium]
MSLILPISQITARTVPDAALRTDSPDPGAGAPFAQELLQALGVTVAPQTDASGSNLPAGTAAERLDPLGAALRALLGGETAAEGTELPTESPELAEPELQDPAPSASVLAELAAGLALVEPVPALAVPAPPEPVSAETAPTNPVPPQLPPSPVVPMDSPVAQVMTLTAAETVAEILPGPPAEPESEPVADHPSAGGPKVTTTKGPTFDDLVQLITGAQARDTVRHAPKQANPGTTTALEPAAEATTLAQSAPTPEGEPEAISPVGHRADGPKPTFGELLSTPAADSRPARSTEIPAPALLNQVSRSIRLLAEGARSELHIKLHPAELGEVLVRLTIQDGLLTAQLQTTDAAVKATLDANLDALKARFEQHGLQVNSLAVSTGAGQLTDDGQAKSGWAQPSNQSSRQAPGDDGEGEEPEDALPPTPARRILGRRGLSRLDHLA